VLQKNLATTHPLTYPAHSIDSNQGAAHRGQKAGEAGWGDGGGAATARGLRRGRGKVVRTGEEQQPAVALLLLMVASCGWPIQKPPLFFFFLFYSNLQPLTTFLNFVNTCFELSSSSSFIYFMSCDLYLKRCTTLGRRVSRT